MAENLKVPDYKPNFTSYVLHLPLRTADVAATGRLTPMYQKALDHPAFDSFWRAISIRERIEEIRVPVYSVGGWYDNFVESDLEAFAALHKSTGLSRIVVGPWPHNMSYKFRDVDFGPESQVAVRGLQLAWFDHWLKGADSPQLSSPPVKIFVMGSNKWREEREWPPAEARPRAFYLRSGGGANTLKGDGRLADDAPVAGASDRFVFDPLDPAPARGGAVCCNPIVFPWGPMDQRPVEARKDVLVYSTPPLTADLEVIGPVRVTLYAATSARDTDFTAKLVDVAPDGYARNLTDGILRLRYRDSLERPSLASPGEVYRITIDAGVTANVFLKRHRIRLEISSSNFPRFDRNSNTGGQIADETRLLKATQTVYHDRERPSQFVLMTMPSKAEEPRAPLTRRSNPPAPPNSGFRGK
jgi:putative CocE/NonD family hydrolase